jgi:phage tail sheath protein FI
LQSDVTTAVAEAWRFGGASRLMGAVLREARRTGEAAVFEANGPTLWQTVRRSIEATLERFWHAGALDGESASEAYVVRCDQTTMTQSDLDNGRVKVEITVRPTHSIERITIVLALNGGGETMLAAKGVA